MPFSVRTANTLSVDVILVPEEAITNSTANQQTWDGVQDEVGGGRNPHLNLGAIQGGEVDHGGTKRADIRDHFYCLFVCTFCTQKNTVKSTCTMSHARSDVNISASEQLFVQM